MDGFHQKVSFIWSIADLLRGDYKPSDYGKVILPFTVLRRLDSVSVANASGLSFIKLNTAGPARGLARYIRGFPSEVREILDCFAFGEQIARLRKAGLLPLIIRRFCEVDLHPNTVGNREMGYIFEELIRRFSEQSGETAGEHYTPREVIRLMVRLVFEEHAGGLTTLFDPACGTGGMLSLAEEYLGERSPKTRLEIHGQELNRESYAICKADAMLKGHDAGCIVSGNSFLRDGFAGRRFDYMLSNPPFGVEWKKAEKQIRVEHRRRGFAGRFGAGLPRVSDGSLLFLQHMLSKMRPEGSRIGVVFNGSPLFAGDAGSGESEIRKWILENDWLEAIVALPDQLFYNTGLSTYIWVLANRKTARRKGKVQLVNAAAFCAPMRRSLGAKRNEMSPAHIDQIAEIYRGFSEGPYSKILRNQDLGYRSIVVERPLRLNFQASAERIGAVKDKFSPDVVEVVQSMDPCVVYRDQAEFDRALASAFLAAGRKFGRTLSRKIREALGLQDDGAEIYRDAKSRPVADPDLRDSENVPLQEDARAWFRKEVLPYAPDAWMDEARTRTGYSIPFARLFFEPEPLRPLSQIEREIARLEAENQSMLLALGDA